METERREELDLDMFIREYGHLKLISPSIDRTGREYLRSILYNQGNGSGLNPRDITYGDLFWCIWWGYMISNFLLYKRDPKEMPRILVSHLPENYSDLAAEMFWYVHETTRFSIERFDRIESEMRSCPAVHGILYIVKCRAEEGHLLYEAAFSHSKDAFSIPEEGLLHEPLKKLSKEVYISGMTLSAIECVLLGQVVRNLRLDERSTGPERKDTCFQK